MSLLPNRRIKVAIPLQEVEAINEPVGMLSIPESLADEGYVKCSMWVTQKLVYLANEIGRQGVAVTSTKIVSSDDPEISEVIELYGVRIQDYVLLEEKQYDSLPN